MTTGLRELRQQASDLVRRAESGETITVTVSGREVPQLGPLRRNRRPAARLITRNVSDLAGLEDLVQIIDLAPA